MLSIDFPFSPQVRMIGVENRASQHNGNSIEGPLKGFDHSAVMFEGAINCSPVMPRDASLANNMKFCLVPKKKPRKPLKKNQTKPRTPLKKT